MEIAALHIFKVIPLMVIDIIVNMKLCVIYCAHQGHYDSINIHKTQTTQIAKFYS